MTEQDKLELEQLRAENAKLKAERNKALSLSMSEKGCVSVYGLNAKFPVSLYPQQWEKLIAFTTSIQQFITANEPELTRRGDASKAAKAVLKAVPSTNVRAVG
jgi:hypothetical protein